MVNSLKVDSYKGFSLLADYGDFIPSIVVAFMSTIGGIALII